MQFAKTQSKAALDFEQYAVEPLRRAQIEEAMAE